MSFQTPVSSIKESLFPINLANTPYQSEIQLVSEEIKSIMPTSSAETLITFMFGEQGETEVKFQEPQHGIVGFGSTKIKSEIQMRDASVETSVLTKTVPAASAKTLKPSQCDQLVYRNLEVETEEAQASSWSPEMLANLPPNSEPESPLLVFSDPVSQSIGDLNIENEIIPGIVSADNVCDDCCLKTLVELISYNGFNDFMYWRLPPGELELNLDLLVHFTFDPKDQTKKLKNKGQTEEVEEFAQNYIINNLTEEETGNLKELIMGNQAGKEKFDSKNSNKYLPVPRKLSIVGKGETTNLSIQQPFPGENAVPNPINNTSPLPPSQLPLSGKSSEQPDLFIIPVPKKAGIISTTKSKPGVKSRAPPPPVTNATLTSTTVCPLFANDSTRKDPKGESPPLKSHLGEYDTEREPSLDVDLSEASSTTYGDTYATAANGFSLTESYYSARLNTSHDDADDDTLRNQSDQLSVDSIEFIMPSAESSINDLNLLEDDGAFIHSAADYEGSQVPATSFTVVRKRKVELSSVSSPTEEGPCSGLGSIGSRKDTTASELCLATGTFDEPNTSAPLTRRFNSVSDVPDSNVLRKVASLTLAEQQNPNTLSKAVKPKVIPDKYKTKGQDLINWIASCYFKDELCPKDTVIAQSTILLSILQDTGFLKPTEQSETTLDKFRPESTYHWAFSESDTLPGKLGPICWPPTQDGSQRNGAKYTEAGVTEVMGAGVGSECSSRTLSPEHLPEKGTVPKTVSHFESESDLTRQSSPEVQQLMMNMKREHKETLQKANAQHDLKVFEVRGEVSQDYDKILQENSELKKLVETLLTERSIKDLSREIQEFTSPVTENSAEPKNIVPDLPLPTEVMTNQLPLPPCPPPLPGMPCPPPPPPPPPGISGPPPPPGMPGPPPPPGMPGPPPPPGMPGPPPPPGMPGPPPPPGMPGPPPPPGMTRQAYVARKQLIVPKADMKNLYWSAIRTPIPLVEVDGDLERCKKCWEKIDEVKLEDCVLDNFTKLFSRPVAVKKDLKEKGEDSISEGDETTKRKQVVTPRAVSVLDYKRQQNVGIFVQSNKLGDISRIRDAIIEFDTTEVSHEILQQILETKATDDEIALLKAHVDSNPDVPLDKADKFLYDLNSIPNFTERVACITFQGTFMESLKATDGKLSNFSCLCHKLMKSPELHKILALILTYGNYMNGGNKQRGQADGFALDILPKLKDVKSSDNSYTFLHYIVGQYITMYDDKRGEIDAKAPLPDRSEIDKASELKFDAIGKELMTLRSNLQGCEKQTETVINSSTDDVLEPFKTKMTKFLENANEKLCEVEENFAKGKETFVACMKFFDYIPKKGVELGDPFDFFAPWRDFCSDFKDIWSYEQQKAFNETQKSIEKKKTGFRHQVKESNKKVIKDKGKVPLSKMAQLREKMRRKLNED